MPAEVRGEEIVVTLGDRRYRVRGLSKNLSYELMKENRLEELEYLLVHRGGRGQSLVYELL